MRHSRKAQGWIAGARAVAALAALAVLGGCAEFGAGGGPIMPPAPPAPAPERVSAAEAQLVETYREVCINTGIGLEGAADRLASLGFGPGQAVPVSEGTFTRFYKDDLVVELRLGPTVPVQASNCLAFSPVLSARAARAAATRSFAGSARPYRLMGPEEARTLSSDAATVALIEAESFDGVAVVVDTIFDGKRVGGLSLIKTR